MKETNNLERLLKIILLLSSKRGYTSSELAVLYGCDQRTIRRDFKRIESVGIFINKDGNKKTIDTKNSNFSGMSDVLHLTEEEAEILNRAFDLIDDESRYTTDLVEKLQFLFDTRKLKHFVKRREESEAISAIKNAIRTRKKVVINDYKSLSSNSLPSNRVIEPFDFEENYKYVWAYELKSNKNKLFKINRSSKISILNHSDWEFEQLHKKGKLDIFGFDSLNSMDVCFSLSSTAYNLIIEEFPKSKQYINEEDGIYVFRGKVSSYIGVSRFVLGLIDEIKVLGPPDFVLYLKNKIDNF